MKKSIQWCVAMREKGLLLIWLVQTLNVIPQYVISSGCFWQSMPHYFIIVNSMGEQWLLKIAESDL